MTVSDHLSTPPTGFSRHAVIVGGVVLVHVAALWALQAGLIRRAAEIVVPVQILSPSVELPRAKEAPPTLPPPAPEPAPAPVPRPRVVKAPPPPRPTAIREPTPAPDAPTGIVAPQPPAPASAPPAPSTPAPPAPPAAPAVQLPSTDAHYLNNPTPVYPAMSKRLGEQGKTIVRVLIGADGLPQSASIRQSSGYQRLDDAARAAVLGWRYVPGKRNGVVEAMEFNVPINWVLN